MISNIINTKPQPKTVETRRILYSPMRTKNNRKSTEQEILKYYVNIIITMPPESLYMLNVVNAIKNIFIVWFFFLYFLLDIFYFSKVCLVSYNIENIDKVGVSFLVLSLFKKKTSTVSQPIKLLCQRRQRLTET